MSSAFPRFTVAVMRLDGRPEGNTATHKGWSCRQVEAFTGMPPVDVLHLSSMVVTFDDGGTYIVARETPDA